MHVHIEYGPYAHALSAADGLQLHANVLQDFYSKDCWQHHPKPYADFLEYKKKERAELEAERRKMVKV